jgi:hypothetical protein
MGVQLSIAILIAGMVGTARLILDAHTVPELVWGYLTGIASMLISILVLGT